jgi:dTDP-glucose 4,6-dehydratase
MHAIADLPHSDLKEIIARSENIAYQFKNSKILISGATGFIGTWLTKTLILLDHTYDLGIQLNLTVRDVESSRKRFKSFPKSRITFLEIDYLLQSKLPTIDLSHIVFSSTPSQPSTGGNDDSYMERVSRNSFKSLVEITNSQENPPIFCNLSSGAVYGKKSLNEGPAEEKLLSNDAADRDLDIYGRIKAELELEVEKLTKTGQIQGVNPRLFAFSGPGISLDAHFAIGNFMNDALKGEEIKIKGHPNTKRSYLYPTDLIVWLLNTLVKPTLNPVHIGSENTISLLELAQKISAMFSSPGVSKGDNSADLSFYVPETSKTRKLMGVDEEVTLDDSLLRWKDWLIGKPRS